MRVCAEGRSALILWPHTKAPNAALLGRSLMLAQVWSILTWAIEFVHLGYDAEP